jgi:hypothetical protein
MIGDMNNVSGGHEWRATSVRQMIRNSRIAGIRSYRGQGRGKPLTRADWREAAVRKNGEYVMGDWVALTSVETWEHANIALDKNRTEQDYRRRYLLSGIMRCGICLGRMSARPGRTPGQKDYVCPGKAYGTCGRVTRQARLLEPYISALVANYLETKANEPAPVAVQIPFTEADRIREQIFAIREGFTARDGSVSNETMFTVLPILEKQLAAALREEPKQRKASGPVTPAKMLEVWLDPEASVVSKRAVLDEIVQTIKVNPANRRGRAPWNPSEEVEVRWISD